MSVRLRFLYTEELYILRSADVYVPCGNGNINSPFKVLDLGQSRASMRVADIPGGALRNELMYVDKRAVLREERNHTCFQTQHWTRLQSAPQKPWRETAHRNTTHH